MATLEKIRSKGVLLLIVVGAALLIFIIGDFVNSGSTYFNQMKANVAKVNGDKIKITDYDPKINELSEVIKLEYGTNINEDISEQIREMVWNNTINEKVLSDECENIGMTITKDELEDMIIGTHISPILSSSRMFMNAQGQFDPNNVKYFLAQIDDEALTQQMSYDDINRFRTYWRYTENSIKTNRLQEKYNGLIQELFVTNKLEAEYAFEANKTQSTVVYAKKDYFAIADSTIEVSDKEILALYNKKKEQYKQNQSAEVAYIAVEIAPSTEDYQKAEAEINRIKEEFATTEEIAAVTNENSDVQYRNEYLTKDQIDKDFIEFSFTSGKDSVYGPIFNKEEQSFKMARIVESATLRPDSVKLSHIYLHRESAQATLALADSIENALKQGADFAELAKTHSMNTQNAANGGEIGWISELGVDKEICDNAFTLPVGKTFRINNGNDINLFIINDVKEKVEKVKLAVIVQKLDASSETQRDLYNKLKEYVVANNITEKFQANAKENNYEVITAMNVGINSSMINNIVHAREAVRWIYKNKPGKVSDVFEVDNYIMAVAIINIFEEGYQELDNVKDILMAEIRKDKKAEILIKEAEGKNIAQLIGENYTTDTINNVNFASNYSGSLGNEPCVFARVQEMELNKESEALKGNAGVIVFKVIDRTSNEKEYNEKEEMVMLNARERYMIPRLSIETLKKAANIKDYRYKYY